MPVRIFGAWRLWSILILLWSLGLLVACSGQAEPTAPEKLAIRLLVREPDGPLPAGKPLNVKSRSKDGQHGISHVELYAVELPTGQRDILIRADEAPFWQTSFTASQVFTPLEIGHYVIKVVGYNKIGDKVESEYISFDVVK
jgi:hypothetical protein